MNEETVTTDPQTDEQLENDQEESKNTKWKQYVAGVAASMSMVAVGAWYSWPTELLPQLLSPSISPVLLTSEQALWMIACIEIGNLVAPCPATYVADTYGRKASILLIAPISFVSLTLVVFFENVVSLCVARLIQGIAISIACSITPIYLGEIASAESRGRMTSLSNLFWSLGCLIPYCVQPFLTYCEFNHATFLLTVLFLMAFFWQPETPYFHAMNGDEERAAKVLKALRDSPTETSIRRELDEIKLEVIRRREEKAHWGDLLSTAEDRRALAIIIFTGMVLQLSGQNAISSYAKEIFSLTPNTFIPPDLVIIVVGIAALLGSVFNVFVSDRFGRRSLLLMSSTGCFLSLSTASGFFYLRERTEINVTKVSWIAPMAVLGYTLFLAAGISSVVCSYTSELFPTKNRAVAGGVSNTNQTLTSFLVLKLYENSKEVIGIDFLFITYSIASAIGIVVFYCFMPETKGKTFLEIRRLLRPIRACK